MSGRKEDSCTSGTKIGGTKAAKRNKKLYGKDFYKIIGAKGGKLGKTGGFASQLKGADGLTGRERARLAGAKGGKVSSRAKFVPSDPNLVKRALGEK